MIMGVNKLDWMLAVPIQPFDCCQLDIAVVAYAIGVA